MTKKCKSCNKDKNISLFGVRKDTISGYRNECKDCRSEKSKVYYKKNKDLILCKIDRKRKRIYDLEYRKKYVKNNRYKVNESQRKTYNKYKNEPMRKLVSNVRSRIRASFNVKKWNKNNTTKEILGCDFETLYLHIESKFTNGMCWSKIGSEIHIDHVIPLATAKTEGDVLRLNHYTNLQPLWASDNLKKGGNLI